MRHRWPEDTPFHRVQLDVESKTCSYCAQRLHICAHRSHPLFTLHGPVELLCRVVHCSDPFCPARCRTISPIAELSLALPGWLIGWDVFCWIGHRRFARHWSVPQIQAELRDSYRIVLSPDAISGYVRRYRVMLAARQQDPVRLADAYQSIDSLVLSIDGLQPEKGHETLYAVRELKAGRIWFAEALLCSKEDEVRRLLHRAKAMAQQLGKPIRLWLSDKQDAFVKGIALEFPGVPHRYCNNHFLRDLAKPTMEADSHAKVQMRKRVRGLRAIEREAVKQLSIYSERQDNKGVAARDTAASASGKQGENHLMASSEKTTAPKEPNGTRQAARTTAEAERWRVVLAYCTAVRGILNDDQGGPLSPPGLRMARALAEVRASLQRILALNKPMPAQEQLQRLRNCIDRGLDEVAAEQEQIKEQVEEITKVAATLDEATGSLTKRRGEYKTLLRQYKEKEGTVYEQMSKVMESFMGGLFVGVRRKRGEKLPSDNLDLERWFRKPKGHERHIHGHKHAGVRIVQEGATLLLALDAHEGHSGPFTAEDLLAYRDAAVPPDEREALQRRKIMRKARSQKKSHSSFRVRRAVL